MEIRLLFFGISADFVGTNNLEFSCENIDTINDLKIQLKTDFPALKNLQDFAIAINENYANDGDVITQGDTIAIIPPVSGG